MRVEPVDIYSRKKPKQKPKPKPKPKEQKPAFIRHGGINEELNKLDDHANPGLYRASTQVLANG